MLLQIYFEVPAEKGSDFQKIYTETYVPAMRKQKGYLGSKLLRLFPPEIANEIEAVGTEFNFQMELMFDTEENRRLWVASEEHVHVWPLAEQIARKAVWRWYDVVGDDAVD